MAGKKDYTPIPHENDDMTAQQYMLRGLPPSYEESQGTSRKPPPSYFASTSNKIPMFVNTPSNLQGRPHSSYPTKVVEFDSGARFKGKGSGSLSVPPPPPGYQPTPAQLAALQGQPVILKKKRNSFF